jgi:hypothetical protein
MTKSELFAERQALRDLRHSIEIGYASGDKEAQRIANKILALEDVIFAMATR